jgi:two-component system sensor histidine kinase BaeS
MKTKIFLAFITVITAALLSNFIFERFIIRDFDNYIEGVREDQIYWLLAAVEGSYSGGRWDRQALSDSIHWGMMLGMDLKVTDNKGKEIITSTEVMRDLSEGMRRRMDQLYHVHKACGPFSDLPLYSGGRKIGTFLSRAFPKEELKEKETVFKKRVQHFMLVSFLIAGSGLIIIALLFSLYLSRPITSLKKAADRISKRDFNVTVEQHSGDEVGKLSEAFNIMASSLRREEELRKHLTSNITHELRTPLTIMKSNVEAMQDGIITDFGIGFANIRNEINRLIELVGGIEDITRAEASFFTNSEETEINIGEFLSGITSEMRPLFSGKGLSIEVNIGEELLAVADTEKLEKVVRNLLSNCLKFTTEGGTNVGYGSEGDMFFICIRDTGRGITADELPNIFNRYYRVEKSQRGGLGLGLAIVKELVDVMGGKVEVESREGEGTEFRLHLPIGGRG